jgi:hypothetical protein
MRGVIGSRGSGPNGSVISTGLGINLTIYGIYLINGGAMEKIIGVLQEW